MLRLSGASTEANSLFVFELESVAYREQVVGVFVLLLQTLALFSNS